MRASAALAALAVVLGAGGCGGGDDGGEDGRRQLDLVIGSLVPLTGPLSDYGPAGRKAARLAGAQINAASERAGADHTVEIVVANSGAGPAVAAEAAEIMADSEGATCITGAWAAADTIETAKEIAIPEQILLISPASTSDEITTLDDDGLVDRTVPPDALQGPSLAEAIADELGGAEGRTVNVGARDDDYGTGIADSFSEAWEELGGTVGQEVVYEPDQPTYGSTAEQIVEGAPDAFVIIDYPETFARIGPALLATGAWDPTSAWSTAALASPELPALVGEEIVEGMRVITPASPGEGEGPRAFDALFRAAAPKAVGRRAFDAQEFDATILCYLAAVSAGSTDGKDMADSLIDLTAPGGTVYGWQQLPEAIEALERGEDIDYTGASGPIDMDENGDAAAGVYDLYRFTAGELRIVGQLPVSAGG